MSIVRPSRAITSCMFDMVFFETHVTWRDHDDGEIFVDERNRPMLEFSGSATLGVNVGYFLELESAFQSKRVVRSAADE